jgi:hypothetical protein
MIEAVPLLPPSSGVDGQTSSLAVSFSVSAQATHVNLTGPAK